MPAAPLLYAGIKGSVVAIDPDSGREAWSVHLKGSEFVSVLLDGDKLYAATHGELFCLDPATGEERWHNPLKGYGWGLVSLASSSALPSALQTVLAERRRQEEARRAAASSSSAAT